MICGTVKTQVDAERDGGPCWILCAAVETYLYSKLVLHKMNRQLEQRHLVGRLRLELVEDFDRLALGGQALQDHCV